MSMPGLWSDDVLAPRPRPVARQVAVVPRERVYGETGPSPQALAAEKAARRERERQEAIAAAWAEGFRAAELKFGLGVYYERPTNKTMTTIVAEVASKHGFTFDEMTSARRQRDLVIARQEAMWRCKKETPYSLPRIGTFFGGRDHTTVLHAVRRHEERMAREAEAK